MPQILNYLFNKMKTIIQTSTLGESIIIQIDLIKKINRNWIDTYIKIINASLIYAMSLNSYIFYGNQISHLYIDKYINNLQSKYKT